MEIISSNLERFTSHYGTEFRQFYIQKYSNVPGEHTLPFPTKRCPKSMQSTKSIQQNFDRLEIFKADFCNTLMITGVVGYYQLIAFWDQRAFYFSPEFFPNTFIWMVWSSVFSAVYCGFFFQNATNAALFQRATRDF